MLNAFNKKNFRNSLIFLFLPVISLSFVSISGFIFLFNSNLLYEGHYWLRWFSIVFIVVALHIIFFLAILKRTVLSYKKAAQNDGKLISSMESEIARLNLTVNNLTNLYNSLIQYDSLKTDFFSNISHELKTPITIILGAIQLSEQKRPSITNERRKSGKHMMTIKQNCYRLLRLINNILDITRLDSGYIKANMVNCNIVYLVEEITQSVIPYSEQKSLYLEFDTDTEEVITAVDIDKIERIILNLLSNAIKFTPPGGKIWVTLSHRDSNIIISVKDTGCGIPAEMKTVIFERFRQTNSLITRENEGSGIGLSLVKSFIELHGGTIRVESEINKGSEFIIELPVRIDESEKAEAEELTCSSHSKIIEAINIEFSDIYGIAS